MATTSKSSTLKFLEDTSSSIMATNQAIMEGPDDPMAQEGDDGSRSASSQITDNEPESESSDTWAVDEDHSFDHVLDAFPSQFGDASLSKLCEYCEELVDTLPRVGIEAPGYDIQSEFDTDIDHVPGPLALEQSAKAGCELCRMFLHSMDLDGNEDSHTRIAKYISEWRLQSRGAPVPHGTVVFYRSRSSVARHKIYLKFHLSTSEHPNFTGPITSFIYLRRTSKPRKSSQGVDEMSGKLILIAENPIFQRLDGPRNTRDSLPLVKEWFIACQMSHQICNDNNSSFMPTRLIDLRESCPRLRLRSDSENEAFLRYATLSHCWGEHGMKRCTLTTSNLPILTSRIPWDLLPKTFLDAIDICRELDIDYIWIDSLCIIQDDTEDWNRESVAMVNVYSGGILNIAASGASDGSQGCFFERKDMRVCQISVKFDESNCLLYDCIPEKHPLEHNRHCPLETCAWTLQERLLSPRTLHFTRKEVFWECHAKLVSESSPFQSDNRCRLRKRPLSREMWGSIVWRYSGRDLTYGKDKLIALAGIANAIQRQTKDGYYAGMWRDNLAKDLCWIVKAPEGWCCNKSPPRAPTWSWASIDKQCVLPNVLGYPAEITILDIKNSTPCENPFGDMPHAKLWLACLPLLVGTINHAGHIETPKGMLLKEQILKFDYLREIPSSAGADIYILRVLSFAGLLLKATGGSQGEYKRVGLWYPRGELLRKDIFEDQSIYANEKAYVPKNMHQYNMHPRVITLV